MSYIEFKYKHPTGAEFTVVADVSVTPPLSFCPHTAASRDDLGYSVEVKDLMVIDTEGKDVTKVMCNVIPDKVFIRECELRQEEDEDSQWEDMHLNSIYTEAESYYE